MKSRALIVLAVIVAAAVIAAPEAQAIQKPLKGHIQFGGSWPQGDAEKIIDAGWSLHGGATMYPWEAPLGVRFDVGVEWWDADSGFLDDIGVDDGWSRMWSLTAELLYEPNTSGPVGFYAGVGGGGYFGYLELTEPGYAYGWYCDYYWGYCYPGAVAGDYVIDSESVSAFGLKASVGVTFKTSGGGQFYLEANYNWVDTANPLKYMPVAIGYRW